MNNLDIATRCLDAAADLDPDDSASPTELAAIALTIARRIDPDRDHAELIAALTRTDAATIRAAAELD